MCVLAPEDPDGPILLSLACEQLGQKMEALRAAREAVRLAPGSVRCLVTLSQAELAAGHVAAAADAARQAIEAGPENPSAHHQSGMILLRYGHNEDAEEAFLKVLELEPDSASALNNLALARLARGDRREAIAGLERAARTDPTMAAVHSNLERFGISPVVVVLYALAVAGLVGGVIWTSTAPGVLPAALLVCSVLAFPAIGMLERRVTRLSPASAARIGDARRVRRYRPWTMALDAAAGGAGVVVRAPRPRARMLVWYGMRSAVSIAFHLWILLAVSVVRCLYALDRLGTRQAPPSDAWHEEDADVAMRAAWEQRDREAAARERALVGLRRRR